MENRFGVKDFFLFILLAAVIVLIGLAMKQYDRQWDCVQMLQQQSNEQLKELVKISRALERGVAFGNSTSQTSGIAQGPDPFANLRKLRNEGGYNEGDWLVQNFGAPVAKLTPLLSTDLYAAIVQARVMESLAYRDPETLEYSPLLATAWQISPDGLTITFQLRQGVTFSDGSPFTADDVVFTYDWVMNPKVEAPRDRAFLEKIGSVTRTNDYEVVFRFKEPYFQSFEMASGLGIMSKGFYSKYTPEQFNNSLGLLIGTGPYRLQSPTDWKPNPDHIDLIRSERYWGLSPSFDRLVFYQIQQESTEEIKYGNGELDTIAVEPQTYQLMLKKPDIMARSSHFEYMSPISGYNFIAWNELREGRPTVFADKRVRQAMTMLTDREGICKNILLGYAEPARGPFSPLSKQDDKSLKDWTCNPDTALALLREVGFADRDSSGILSLADGTKLSFRLTYPSKSETTDRIMRYIKDGYARFGVRADLNPEDWTIVEQEIKTRKFDAISLGWSAGLEDDIRQMFDSSQMAEEADDFMSYANPELDKAIRTARTTVDEAKRMELWHECERIIHEDQPYTFLVVRKSLRFFDKRIQNVHESKTGLNFVQDWDMPMPWYVPPGEQKYTH